jgi:hypothetical protein
MEQINFKGNIQGKVSGEPVYQKDMDFRESWPEVTRIRQILAADTTSTELELAGVATAKIVAIKVEHPVYVVLGTSGDTATERWLECRGNMVAQVNCTHVFLENTTAQLNEVNVFVAGI